MNTDNVQLVRRAYEAYGRGETTMLTELVDPDLEWTFLDPSVENPRPEICRGREQLIYWMNHQSERGLHSILKEATGYGDRVLIVIQTPGIEAIRVSSSDDLSYYVLTLREGRVVALRACRSRDEAVGFADGPGEGTGNPK